MSTKLGGAKPGQKLTVAQFGSVERAQLCGLIDGILLEAKFIKSSETDPSIKPQEVEDARERITMREAALGKMCSEAIINRRRIFFTDLADITGAVFDRKHLQPKFHAAQRAIVIGHWLHHQLGRWPTKGELRAEMANRGAPLPENWSRFFRDLGWQKLPQEKGGRGKTTVIVKGGAKIGGTKKRGDI